MPLKVVPLRIPTANRYVALPKRFSIVSTGTLGADELTVTPFPTDGVLSTLASDVIWPCRRIGTNGPRRSRRLSASALLLS